MFICCVFHQVGTKLDKSVDVLGPYWEEDRTLQGKMHLVLYRVLTQDTFWRPEFPHLVEFLSGFVSVQKQPGDNGRLHHTNWV